MTASSAAVGALGKLLATATILGCIALLLPPGAILGAGLARASASWKLEQPPPPDGAVFKEPLGIPDDLEFLAPNEGLLSVQGTGLVPPGLFFWNGHAWHQLSTVCGGSGEISRIAWAGPEDFWVLTEPSEPRVGSGLGLCHFRDGVVVASYSTPLQSPDPFRTMDSAACDGPDDCWFAGIGSEDPSGQRVGAFHLHWNGTTLTTSYQPQGRGVSALAFYTPPGEATGSFYETTFVGARPGDRSDAVTLDTKEPEGPQLIHRLDAQTEVFEDVPFLPEPYTGPLNPNGVGPEGTELLSAHADEQELWLSGGGAASGPEAPETGSVPGPPVAVRYDTATGSFEQVALEDSLFQPQDRLVDISPVPGSEAAWAAVQQVGQHGSITGKARVALIPASEGASHTQLFTLPARGAGRGSAQLVAATGPEEAWMVTSAGWVFHYTNGAVLPEDTDPTWAGTITVRPNESVAQFVPDTPPPDDSELFAPPPVQIEHAGHSLEGSGPQLVIPALLKDVKVARHGLTVVVSFQLTRLADVGLVAKLHHRVIARTGRQRMKPGRHSLRLTFNRAHWPTALSFQTKELTKPKPVPASGSGGGSGSTGPNVVGTSAHWLTLASASLRSW